MRRAVVLTALTSAACLYGVEPGPGFDGKRAFEHVRQLVEIGPRPAGSPGAARAREYIAKQLGELGLKVDEQAFDAKTPLGVVRMVNLRATFPSQPASGPRLLITGHYDTKLFEEFTFVGANDGGSSAAFLIEIARVLKDAKRPLPIELVFFDGEEAVIDWNQGDDNTYGSRHHAAQLVKSRLADRVRCCVLLDLVGDRDLKFLQETYSDRRLNELFGKAAEGVGLGAYLKGARQEAKDDHLSFMAVGIPSIDLIDFDYGPDNSYWHTPQDTIDKCSAESLGVTGRIVLAALPEIERSFRRK